jgi:diadenosine tetraphosphatase ApaH/serine/threonine PP2A family protein phosphatase
LWLGDFVGYGGDPLAVITRARELPHSTWIRGNHDKVCAGLESAAGFNAAARKAALWTASVLPAADRGWLAALPRGPVKIDAAIEICHGSPFNEDYYVLDDRDAARAARSASGRLCFFGHTHVPALFASPEHRVEVVAREVDVSRFRLPAAGQVLINVGAVGQPRDGDARAAYGLFNSETLELELRRVPYDVGAAQEAIRRAGLPDWLADRLKRGM